MDCARFNFAHGQPTQFRVWAKQLRRLAKTQKRELALIQDLEGPRLRVGTFSGGQLKVRPNHKVSLPLERKGLKISSRLNQTVLISGGQIEGRLLDLTQDSLTLEVANHGFIQPKQSINLPGAQLVGPALTQKDRADLKVGLSMGVDYVSLSFAKQAQDVESLKKALAGRARVIAKIERPQALDNLESLIEAADAIMIARGDLGLELPPEQVPVIQKKIISLCLRLGRPVITATQMLESMVGSNRPSRAETSDVANAVLDGTDAIMLSAETSLGQYPVEAVATARAIIREIELNQMEKADFSWPEGDPSVPEAIGLMTGQLAQGLKAKAIIAATRSGASALALAKHRPAVVILAASPNQSTRQALALVWGVRPIEIASFNSTDRLLSQINQVSKSNKLAQEGDKIVVVAGHPIGGSGQTNMIKVIHF